MYPFFATCPKGLEEPLCAELTQLGAVDAAAKLAGVSFQATMETVYRMLLWSRLTGRLLLRLKEFTAHDSDQLYEGVLSTLWEDHLEVSGSFRSLSL